MDKQQINQRANKVLTNKFTGNMEVLNNVTTPRVSFSIQNLDGSESKCIALFCGILDTTEQIINAQLQDDGSYADVKAAINAMLAAAGYPVDAVLATFPSGSEDNQKIVMAPADSTKSIEAFKRYFKTNAHFVKNITIVANNADGFNSTINFCNKMYPYKRSAINEIDMQKFLSVNQYNSKKIEIPFAEGEMEISDQLWLDINVPAGETYKLTIELYD